MDIKYHNCIQVPIEIVQSPKISSRAKSQKQDHHDQSEVAYSADHPQPVGAHNPS
jgi:hypothetical protein